MAIKYNIKYKNYKPFIIYNPDDMVKEALINRKNIFEYKSDLHADNYYRSYNILEEIRDIDPIVLKAALLNQSELFRLLDKYRIPENIAKHIDIEHENYYQYLELFDLFIDQNILSIDILYNNIMQDAVNNNKNPVFIFKLINHPKSTLIRPYSSASDIEKLIKCLKLNSDQPNHEGYTTIAKLLNDHNTPTTNLETYNAQLLKIFCINHIKYSNIFEAKKIIRLHNFNSRDQKDISQIARETNSKCYEQISTYIQDVNNIRKWITLVKSNDIQKIDSLINKITDINIEIHDKSLFMFAIEKNHRYTIKQLLEKASNLYIENQETGYKWIHLMLMYAIEKNHHYAITQLLDKTIKLCEATQEKGYKYINFKIMFAIVKQHHLDDLKNLIIEGLKLFNKNQAKFEKPLDYFIQNTDPSSLAVVALLINNNLDINQKDNNCNTLLMQCIQNYSKSLNVHFLNLAKLLIQKGANVNLPNNDKNTPLIEVINTISHRKIDQENQQKCQEVIKLLIESHADINAKDKDGNTPLILALQNSTNISIDIIDDILIPSLKYCNTKNHSGITPLITAIKFNNYKIAIKLIIFGKDINVNLADNDGNTPLMWALKNSDISMQEVISFLIDKGADINAKDNDGNTPLMWALKNSSIFIDTIELLLDKGANINVQNNSGETALMCLLRANLDNGVEFLVTKLKLLIENGLDINTEINKAIISEAYEQGYIAYYKTEVTALLEQYQNEEAKPSDNNSHAENDNALQHENHDENSDSDISDDHDALQRENHDALQRENHDENSDLDISGDHYTSSHDD